MGLGNLTTGPSNIQRKDGEATSHVQQLLQTVCWKFSALQPSHCHHPRPALEAEGWEKPHGAVKSQIASRELDNMGTSGTPSVQATSLLTLLRNCSLTLQTF